MGSRDGTAGGVWGIECRTARSVPESYEGGLLLLHISQCMSCPATAAQCLN